MTRGIRPWEVEKLTPFELREILAQLEREGLDGRRQARTDAHARAAAIEGG